MDDIYTLNNTGAQIDEANEKGLATADYIIQQGVNGIWTYRKWNSGMAECWATVSTTMTVTGENPFTAGGGYVIPTYDFPFTFVVAPSIHFSADVGNGYAIIAKTYKSTTIAKALIYTNSVNGSSQSCRFSIYAFGPIGGVL
jgi:hypothetical protein